MSTNEARELRGQIRDWRRGHADATFGQVLIDAYVGVFSTLVIGSMFVSALVNLGKRTTAECSGGDCRQATTVLPWTGAIAAVVLVLAVARIFGPLFASPATGSWLLPTPVDRGALLRPRTLVTLAIAAVSAAVLAASAVTIGGYAALPIVAVGGGAGAAALVLVAVAGRAQAAISAPSRVLPRLLQWALAMVGWVLLLLLALDVAPTAAAPDGVPALGWLLVAVLVCAAAVGATLVVRGLRQMHARDLTVGSTLAPALSGALATLDLALGFDLLLAHRWHDHLPVRSPRGSVPGALAITRSDLTRLRRSPQRLLVPALAVVVPYAVARTPARHALPLFAVLVGFVALLPLLTGLRVLSRTSGLARAFPFPPATSGSAALVVPAVVGLAYGIALTPAFATALDVRAGLALAIGIASGLGSLAAATRWMCGRPPDYNRPLVSSPAGAVPTNLYGSALRGFDIALLVSLPMLLAEVGSAVTVSLVISVLTIGILVSRRPG